MGALSIKGVRKSYGATHILKGIDIDIKAGQFLTLVGPSGCGKSTLLNIIAGLDSPTSGDIHIGGANVTRLSPKDRNIAMVFQSYALYPNMSVQRNISFGLEIRKVPKQEIDAIVEKVAKILQINHLLDRKPSQLSGGQRQRVAMGRALARDPSLFLFDEPLSNLDAKLRVEMRAEIKQLHQRMNTTIVYVTHDQIEAMTLGDRIAVLESGEVQQFGPPREIYENPANMFVAGFIGSPSMNFIPCKFIEEGGRLGLKLEKEGGAGFTLPLTAMDVDKAYLGKEVILGIRPEQITHRIPSQVNDPNCLLTECKLLICEPTGPDTLVTTQLNGRRVVCRVHPAAAANPGQMMPLMFDMSKAVLFDPQSENRIDKAA